jgi:hypothetical protein
MLQEWGWSIMGGRARAGAIFRRRHETLVIHSLDMPTTPGLVIALALVAGCGGAAGKQLAPAELRSLESNGEGASEAAGAADWTRAVGILGEARTNWTRLKPQVQASAAPAIDAIDAALARLATDVTAQDQRAAETDGNAISRAVPDLFDLYAFAVPSDALRLDAWIRLLQIDASFSDWPASAKDVAQVGAVWSRLRPPTGPQAAQHPDIAGSKTVVVDLDAQVTALMTAVAGRDAATLATGSKHGLDLVDVVEQVFE